MPTRAEIEEHNLTHLPYRSWCRHCVRGREKEFPHKRVGEQGELPELHLDMCFLGEEKDPHNTNHGGHGTECQDDDGHGCASEECEIVYVKEACRVHEGGGYPTR